jgi:methylated-DNA-[protein]-cysteine S-methyltransferase
MIWDTGIGPCGLAWRDDAILGVQLPEGEAGATAARLHRRFPQAVVAVPPALVARVVARIAELLGGRRVDLADAPLDLTGVPPFDRAVYGEVRRIPAGEVRSYGAVAAALGQPLAAREVGAALGRNPFPLLVPCHRVVGSGGRLVGFSAAGGTVTKRRLLAIEGARFAPGPDLFDGLHERGTGGGPS